MRVKKNLRFRNKTTRVEFPVRGEFFSMRFSATLKDATRLLSEECILFTNLRLCFVCFFFSLFFSSSRILGGV